jgi:hypothetical protein
MKIDYQNLGNIGPFNYLNGTTIKAINKSNGFIHSKIERGSQEDQARSREIDKKLADINARRISNS